MTSALFAFHNERNRLLTVARCAPAVPAVRVWLRFGLTTASLAVRHFRTGRPQQALNLQVHLRLRVLASGLRLLPWALVTRMRIRPGGGHPLDMRLGG